MENRREMCVFPVFIHSGLYLRMQRPRHTQCNAALSTPSGARTLDTLIKSQVLYQLS